MSALAPNPLPNRVLAPDPAVSADDDFAPTLRAGMVLRGGLFEWCSRQAERRLEASDAEGAVRWVKTAATLAYEVGHSHFVSARLERLLLAAAGAGTVGAAAAAARTPGSAMRWLHVFTITYQVGGHTNFAARWIEGRAGTDMHDVVATHQRAEDVSEHLRRVCGAGGGQVLSLLPPRDEAGLLARAAALRRLCGERYDAVVLHVHPWDPVPSLAFGAPGGPPVLLLNHADHVFWLGASVADLVLNLRPLGTRMTSRWRDVKRNFELPVPLPAPHDSAAAAAARRAVRQELGISNHTTVLLTVGTGEKYQPLGQLDWLQAARRICERLDDAVIVAVGPQPQARDWLQARADTCGRIVTVGPRIDVFDYHAAADVYLEGFPFGSTTALLEAGLAGLPFVRAPREVPLVYKAGSPALGEADVPADVAAYVGLACRLAQEAGERQRLASAGRQAILSFHGMAAFNARVDELKRRLPAAHTVSMIGETPRLPTAVERHWAAFRLPGDDLFRRTSMLAFGDELRARVDLPLWRELRGAQSAGCPGTSPAMALAGSHVMAALPHRAAGWLLALRRRLRQLR